MAPYPPKDEKKKAAGGPPDLGRDDGSPEWSKWLDDMLALEKEGAWLSCN